MSSTTQELDSPPPFVTIQEPVPLQTFSIRQIRRAGRGRGAVSTQRSGVRVRGLEVVEEGEGTFLERLEMGCLATAVKFSRLLQTEILTEEEAVRNFLENRVKMCIDIVTDCINT